MNDHCQSFMARVHYEAAFLCDLAVPFSFPSLTLRYVLVLLFYGTIPSEEITTLFLPHAGEHHDTVLMKQNSQRDHCHQNPKDRPTVRILVSLNLQLWCVICFCLNSRCGIGGRFRLFPAADRDCLVL